MPYIRVAEQVKKDHALRAEKAVKIGAVSVEGFLSLTPSDAMAARGRLTSVGQQSPDDFEGG